MAEKVLFIINKYSGKGFQASTESQVLDACSKFRVDGVIEYTKHKGHATVLAKQAVAAGITRVFAMGGDGTVNEVAQGLVHTATAMGILPAGSGNGLARHLNIAMKTELALGLLGQHQVIPMDTIQLNGHLAVNVAGIGFDAHVANLFGKNGRRGLIGYAKLVLSEFAKFQEFEGDASIENSSQKIKSFIIALANSSQFGNNARVAPNASVTDGLMDLCFVRKVPLSQAVAFTVRLFMGIVDKSSYVEIVKASSFRLELAEPMPFHIDGEPHPPAQRFDASIQPGYSPSATFFSSGFKRPSFFNFGMMVALQ